MPKARQQDESSLLILVHVADMTPSLDLECFEPSQLRLDLPGVHRAATTSGPCSGWLRPCVDSYMTCDSSENWVPGTEKLCLRESLSDAD